MIWLDDLEQYLIPLGLDEGVLRELAPDGRRDVVVLATIRDEELARLQWTYLHGEAPAEVRAAARLIARIDARRRVAVGRYLSTVERDAITDPDADPRVADALASSFGFAEYLAAGPGMMSRSPGVGLPLRPCCAPRSRPQQGRRRPPMDAPGGHRVPRLPLVDASRGVVRPLDAQWASRTSSVAGRGGRTSTSTAGSAEDKAEANLHRILGNG
ncbi:hypothetical protein OG792_22325 [Micromonospora sp. NBC_01699]|uniref:hypothetical protein n=1 Tax=Micromonospora sp. NBC_01699 TaxID=2975984 RepID=UPI002E2BBA3B|nr:hypothetical protein [Micromonospora sp. NBC_01699]